MEGTMKTKRHSKELKLNKKTIAQLTGNEMKGVNGGIDKPPVSIIFNCNFSSYTKPC